MARPRTFDETAVVLAARERFWTCGYSATSLDDLVRATGLAKGSIYNTFGDKHTLFIRTLESYCTEVADQVDAELEGPDETAAERLRDMVTRSAGRAVTDATPPVACFLAKATAELAALDEEVATLIRRTFTRLEEALLRCVRAAQRAGAIPGTREAHATARHVLVALRGLEALAGAGVDRAVLADAAASLIETTLTSD
jgi:TetR/AcrR family transcriptional repressor of nem operon